MHTTVTAAAKLLATIDSTTAPFEERVAAGEALAALGDPRAKAEDRVSIAAGVLAPAKGHREHEVAVAAFSIDRYPVTVAAYAELIEAGGYDDRSLWTPRGWAWRTKARIEAPRFWGEAEWAAYLVPNHPIVGVSAHEAEAYAAFRGARLPSELEWEWACRGSRGGCYPWGDEWQEDACAQRGYGPRSTVPIGVFPRGASPFGVRDMVGSVWQWCSDAAARGDGDDGPTRVTRGGAWNNLAWSIGCTCRNAYPPDARFSNLGFRCVVG
jgi:gamma-glutamyl hercynylcysteine S-oxide synthase